MKSLDALHRSPVKRQKNEKLTAEKFPNAHKGNPKPFFVVRESVLAAELSKSWYPPSFHLGLRQVYGALR